MAATLILEAIVVLLAIPVVAMVGGGLTVGSLSYLIAVAAVLIVLTGVQGRPWAIWVNLAVQMALVMGLDRKSTRLNSSHVAISYAVFCLKKKKNYYGILRYIN